MRYTEQYGYPYADLSHTFTNQHRLVRSSVFDPHSIKGEYTVAHVSKLVTWQKHVSESHVIDIRKALVEKGFAEFFETSHEYNIENKDECNSDYTPIVVVPITPIRKLCILNGNHRAVALRSLGALWLPVYRITNRSVIERAKKAWKEMNL